MLITSLSGGTIQYAGRSLSPGFLRGWIASRCDVTSQTAQVYFAAFDRFRRWANTRIWNLTPEAVIRYVLHLHTGGARVATIRKDVAGIAAVLDSLDLTLTDNPARHPSVGRTVAELPERRRTTLTDRRRLKLAESFGDSLTDIRDRALLLVGALLELSATQLAELNVRDLTLTGDDIAIGTHTLEATGAPDCALAALQSWLRLRGMIEPGPLFCGLRAPNHVTYHRLSPRSVQRIIAKRLNAIGLDAEAFPGRQ